MHHTGTEVMVPQEAAQGFPPAHTHFAFSGTLPGMSERPNAPGWRIPSS